METIKLYYSIGEVARELDLKDSQIRHWEKEIQVLKPKKKANGKRAFTEKDIEVLKMIKLLVKDKGYTLEGANRELLNKRRSILNKMEVVERLKNIRSFLVSLKA